MERRKVAIRTSADLIDLAKQPQVGLRLVFETPKVVLPREGLSLTCWRDIVIDGQSSPNGKTLFTGGSLNITGCEELECSWLACRVQRPVGALPTRYEKSWKPMRVHAASPDAPCRYITFRNCSFSGHTDELECGPADHAWWYANHMGKPAVDWLRFSKCMFGPSLVNLSPDRIYHNFSLACSLTNNVEISGSVFVGSNRRSPQLAGKGILLSQSCVFDWGTMGTGLHAGAEVQIFGCHYFRGPHTNGKERAVSLVEVQGSNAFSPLGPAIIGIGPECVEYGTHWSPLRRGFQLWQEPESTRRSTWRRTAVAATATQMSWKDIVAQAGCGDSLDQAIRNSLMAGKHIPWISDYTKEFPFPDTK